MIPNLFWEQQVFWITSDSVFLCLVPEEDLLMSIEAADDTADAKNSNSDSGRDSQRTTSSVSTM